VIAYHGSEAIKAKYLARVRLHREADEIIHGFYWKDGKGCAVGCTIHSGSHAAYETELGIPQAIARLEDGIFEGLSNGDAKLFPEQFLTAINVGADLTGVADKFLHWLLVDPSDGVMRYARTDDQRRAIERVGDFYARKIAGEEIERQEWISARENCWSVRAAAYAAAYAADAADAAAAYAAAYADAADAADAAAYAAAAYAAYAAAAAYAAYAAAYAAADASAYAADAAEARLSARKKQRDKLLSLLSECGETEEAQLAKIGD